MEDWETEDPSGRDIEDYREARDAMMRKVNGLLEALAAGSQWTDFDGGISEGTSMSEMTQTTSQLTRKDRNVWLRARLGIGRMNLRVKPGLYSLGRPNKNSPVFVTANYQLSFNSLRSQLSGLNCYILVLDTRGINVWCAAGEGTFGTDEVVRRIESTSLRDLVNHRVLILPQLGAPGVAAQEVKRRTGFKVEWGPVRASDIQQYMRTGEATPEMRRVRFNIRERVELIPVEITNIFLPLLIALTILLLIDMRYTVLMITAMVLAGIVFFPILLPFLPTRDFTSKGLILGVLASTPFMAREYFVNAGEPLWLAFTATVVPALMISPWVGFIALNFTGSTTFTSRTGVRREIFRYIPLIAATFIIGLGLEIGFQVARWYGAI